MTSGRLIISTMLLWCVYFAGQLNVHAQDGLYLVNGETTVRKISFKFPEGNPTFEAEKLRDQLITAAPSFWNRFDRINPFKRAAPFPFDPIELQKDVVRLRQFYRRNGFPAPRISYSASQFNAETNKIHIIFAIWEGAPLNIRSINLLSADSTDLAGRLPENLYRSWTRFTGDIDESIGERFTEVEQIRIQDLILRWLQNNGYAFARVEAQAETSIEDLAVDLRFLITTGPQGYFSEIEVEGNESVSNQVLLRELPFKKGDLYSSTKLREGQQQLFGLNLFRVALADLPQQPTDSTVNVRIRVNESNLRYVSAETGYARKDGITLEGEWTHRNFLGSARNLTINLHSNTGLLGSTSEFTADNVVGKLPARLFRTSVSLRQPYLFTTKLSGIFSPFIEFQNDPQLAASYEFLDINRRELGFSTTLIYEVLPFRAVSLQYTLSQSLSRSDAASSLSLQSRDIYNKSIFGISGTFGQADSYINPKRGFLVKPFFEYAGRIFSSGLQYNKAGIELTGYIPITQRQVLSARLFAGKLWPFGASADGLADRACVAANTLSSTVAEQCLIYESRFDPVFFYAGGSTDVRGWDYQLLGPKFARADTLLSDGLVVTDDDGEPVIENYFYERIGGTGKLIGNIEARSRIPGLGQAWQGAAFFDFGQITNNRFSFSNFKYNVGAGIRYQTIVGYLRLDIAYKLNPSTADLTDPEDTFLYENGYQTEPPEEKFFRRFGFHISIGQAF